MIFIIIILILFILSPPTQAQELFPYQNNPVVFNQPSHNGARHPFVIKEQNQFSLWYADDMPTGFRILRAQSSNGIDWYDKRDTFVTNRQNASDPFVFVADNQYQLYFASSNYSRTSLWKSVSSDGITFIPGAEREILKPEQSWEQFSLSCPAVFQDQSTQYLFYAGAGQTAWAIGMATSADGETWQKCTNNPLISEGVSPQVVKYNDIFYLYFHSPRGLEVQQTNVLNGCDTIWTNRHVIDSEIRDPAPVVVDDDLWIYGTLALPSGSHIGLASSAKIQTPHYPIVIIPGMFASWNKEAILHNSVVSYDAWKLNPNITEYDAIMETLENNGRIVNEDLFVFPYDWRNPIEETTYNLDTFLISKIWKNNPSLPVQLVGHSLGGVVSRIYADQNPLKPIKQIVTVGSPLLGTVQAYKPLVAGEIDRENTLMWMAEKLILLLNKSGFESDKDTISQKLLVLFDILPAFSFLKSEGGTPITSAFTNNLLFQYPIDSAPPIPQQYIGAEGRKSLAGYVLGTKTPLDNLFGSYVDGHPVGSWQEDGDGVVLAKSSLNQISPAPVSNHGEIIYSKNNIKTILSSLGIQAEDSNIPAGKGTSIFPAILTFIQSPATMQITHNNVTTPENEGMIYLQNTDTGNYSLQVIGQSSGEYTVSVWLIGENDDKWTQFIKQTTSGKMDEYTISYDNSTGGTVSEYVVPSPTVTLSQTSTPITTSQSFPSNNTSTQSTNNGNVKNINKNTDKNNTNLTQLLTDAKERITDTSGGKKSVKPQKETVPQVLGALDKKKTYRFHFADLFFIKQILWGICTVILILFYEAKKLKKIKQSLKD